MSGPTQEKEVIALLRRKLASCSPQQAKHLRDEVHVLIRQSLYASEEKPAAKLSSQKEKGGPATGEKSDAPATPISGAN